MTKEKSEIESDMLSMAQGMKAFASSFKDQFNRDEKVLQNIAVSQDANMSKTSNERDRLA